MSNQYDFVIFDVGQTLLGFVDARPFRRLLQETMPERSVSAIEARQFFDRWTAAYHRYNRAIEAKGRTFTAQSFWRAVITDACQGLPDVDTLVAIIEERVWRGDLNLRGLYGDVRPTLKALQARGMPMGIISNFTVHLETYLRRLRIRHFFRFVIASDIVGIRKPDPAIFRLGVEKAGVPASRILYVGDEPVDDVQGALGAGLSAVLLERDEMRDTRSEMRDPESGTQDTPYQRIHTLSELEALL
jgi:FMN phosphatase YigB (HAD superfamily)